jgi:Nitrile hydratase, alpha chain
MADQKIRRAFELQLIEKAWKDAAFRQALVKDPQGAVERELGGKLPARVQVKVVQETADTCYLVLPANPDRAPAAELTDHQLEAVAGGWTGQTAQCGTCQTDCASCDGAWTGCATPPSSGSSVQVGCPSGA